LTRSSQKACRKGEFEMEIKQKEVKICVCGHGLDRHHIDYGMCKATGCGCDEYRRVLWIN